MRTRRVIFGLCPRIDSLETSADGAQSGENRPHEGIVGCTAVHLNPRPRRIVERLGRLWDGVRLGVGLIRSFECARHA